MNAFKLAFVVVVGVGAHALACNANTLGTQESSVATATIDALRSQFKFSARAATDGTSATLPARSVIPQAAVASLETTADNDLAPSSAVEAAVVLPATASGATTIATTNNSMAIAVTLRGATSAAALPSRGSALYSNADPHGGHVVQTVIHDGVESFVTFAAKPSSDTIFDVAMSGVHGLRFVEGVVEFLDKKGAPRLRMAPPVVVDSVGNVADVATTIEGCSYDDSGQAPWDRKVTAPGATTCAIHLSWSDTALTYPVLLDPTWSTTGSMAVARRWHGAILLPTLKVLVINGEGVSAAYIASCELYDPATGTWATVRRPAFASRRFTTTMVAGPRVLIAGGEVSSGRTASAALYDPSTGQWTTTGSMTTSRAYHDAVRLDTGKVLVAGGTNTSGTVLSGAELYDPAAGTWSVTGTLATAREGHTLTILDGGTVLAAGGVDGSSNVLASAESYDPNAASWNSAGTLNVARHRHKAVRLDDGRVLFSGGYTDSGATSTTADLEVYDTSVHAFLGQDVAGTGRADHIAIGLPGNAVLIAGGWDGTNPKLDTQDYSANTSGTIQGADLATGVGQQTATLMGNGSILIAGGTKIGNIITNTCETSGPYFYVWGANGARHQLQFTSVSGSYNTSMTANMLYDSTAFSVVYAWLGGVGATLQATVKDATGATLGTVTTVAKGDATFTNADGSDSWTANRNLVNAPDLSFLDEKVVIAAPLKAMATIINHGLIEPYQIGSGFFNDWYVYTPTPLNQTCGKVCGGLSDQQQADLWQAITDVEETSLTNLQLNGVGDDKFWLVHAMADPTVANGGRIEHQDCNAYGGQCGWCSPSCTYAQIKSSWTWVDVVRSHYIVNHDDYPQFFQHHRWFLDRMVTWINGDYWHAGWVGDPTKGGDVCPTCYNPSGTSILPYGIMPYWDTSVAMHDNNNPTKNFIYTKLPGGSSWGTGLNCHTGSDSTHYHGAGPLYGTSGRRDTAFQVIGAPAGTKCAWEASHTFYQQNYTLTFSDPTNQLCSATDVDFWSGTQPNPPPCSCTNTYDARQGFQCFHNCLHGSLGFTYTLPPNNQGPYGDFFGAFDSPASPLFFPWHAWVDYFYRRRLDCY